MSFCLGKRLSLGTGEMVPKPRDACALPGRPIMSRPGKSEPRSKQLNLSLTERELASIEARAAALGMRAVHFSRALLLEANRAPEAARRTSRSAQNPHSNFDRLAHGQLV